MVRHSVWQGAGERRRETHARNVDDWEKHPQAIVPLLSIVSLLIWIMLTPPKTRAIINLVRLGSGRGNPGASII